ncbi:hypothetical protein E4U42_000365 [Claviceps africana]|uniref:Zn(2)-C6 fungal-type domain-containing protein n=1 Tax=Claviceps africana TaxID=83212 RepID=A0A8K0J2M0_9HYPO|nr:hypothetical protein E4U42_000365 [Claviceps africana]
MAFFKFKLDNTLLRPSPVPIASSYSPSPAAPDGHLKRSASTPQLSNRPSLDEPPALQQLRHGNPPAPCAAQSDARLSLHDGRPRKRPAADAPAAVDSLFRPWSRKTAGARKSTSCLECKLSKTRCERVASDPGDACSRCQRRSKQCVFEAKLLASGPSTAHPPAKSPAAKPRNETTAPGGVRELRESWEMPRVREEWQTRQVVSGAREAREMRRRSTPERIQRTQPDLPSSSCSGLVSQPLTPRPLPSIDNKQLDIKIDSLISRDVAQKVFHHYVDSFVPKCPVVIFAPGTTQQHLRETRPLLFLSILSAASNDFCSAEQRNRLVLESRRALFERAVGRGEQSLELVQALQIASLWYRAPDGDGQLSLTQQTHIMIAMAFDLGLHQVDLTRPVDRGGQEAWDRAEAQRAWLACFVLSTSISMVLRRSNMMSWSSDMDAYLSNLQKAQVSPSDGFFCELVRIEQLYHTMDQRLFLSDRHRSASVRDPLTISMAHDFRSRLNTWRSCCDLNWLQGALIEFSKFAGSLYAHEPVMHINHNINEFEAPFTYKSLQTCTSFSEQIDTPQRLMLREIVTAAHGLLNCFLGIPLVDMLSLPPHIYGGRVIYSLILLCKLYKSMTISTRATADFLLVDDLYLDQYLDRIVFVARDLLALDTGNTLSRSFFIVEQLRKWYHKHRYGSSTSPSAVVTPPHAFLLSSTTGCPLQSHLQRTQTRCGDQEFQRPHGVVSSRPMEKKVPCSDAPWCPDRDIAGRYDWFVDDLFHVDLFN